MANSKIPEGSTVVPVKVPRSRGRQIKTALQKKQVMSRLRRSHEMEINLANPSEFFKKINQPTESRLAKWVQEVSKTSEEYLDTAGVSKIVEIDPQTFKWRWRIIKNSNELREAIKVSTEAHSNFMKLREKAYMDFFRKGVGTREDILGGFGGDYGGYNMSAFPARSEYTPLIGTPFFKQLYLSDYWEMHSKCFWYSNYSGIAKLIVDITRNFVMGKSFSVTFDDPKLQDMWNEYEDRTGIQEAARSWCDDLTKFGECMIKKIPTAKGLVHRSFDPSTVWEIVTDPEDINNIKYYHQQYNTQYQIFGDKSTPLSKYIINQIPPQLVSHTRVNVTNYEKRGRSDLLAALLYFKYYEDYTQAKLIRAKNEAAFIWDVSIKGSDEDVQAYINNTESFADVPPGSENVHNEAITRTAISPQFGTSGADQVAQDILSYVAMATSVPTTYFGTSNSVGGSTKAGALVATEPVAKKMGERQLKMEYMIRGIVKDLLVSNGKDPRDPKCRFEINFPEIMEEDRSQKIQDLGFAKDEKAISHKTFSQIVAKELKITRYDYDTEQKQIQEELRDNPNLSSPMSDPDLTSGGGGSDDSGTSSNSSTNANGSDRSVDRSAIAKQGHSF